MNRLKWQNAYREYAPELLGICRRYVGLKDAEDVLHDAFLRAIKYEKQFENRGSFIGWLKRIVINTALMHLRGNKTNIQLTESMTDISDNAHEPETGLLESLPVSFYQHLIDTLPAHHKLVFNLFTVDEYKHEEIAGMLGISEGTSKSHLFRARKKLKDLLSQKIQKEEKTKKLLLPIILSDNTVDLLFQKKFAGYKLIPEKTFRIPAEYFSTGPGILPAAKGLPVIITAVFIITGVYLFTHKTGKIDEPQPLMLSQPSLPADDTVTKETYSPVMKTDTSKPVRIRPDKNRIAGEGNGKRSSPDTATPVTVIRQPLIIRDTTYAY
ncbi:MAG: RNA polymerase sigma factor [Chitinophagaceae bacterium]